MKDLNEKKVEIEKAIRNSIWEDSIIGLRYKFQNETDCWINDSAHFNYSIYIFEDKLVLKLEPNGKDFFIEFRYGEVLYLHDHKELFELRMLNRL